ncbi:MAG: hypothetical protein JW829_18415 [Pirellulales bacterium]|nr:hypothetical protein [Pirellulales bacterium]
MNTVIKALATLLAVALSGLAVEVCTADTGCCSRCGCQGEVQRICRPICTTRREEVISWDVVRDEICLPRPSRCIACGGISGSDACCPACQLDPCDPGLFACGYKIRPCNKLMRKTFIREIPVIVWVVEYVCPDCANGRTALLPPSAEWISPLQRLPLAENPAGEVPDDEAATKTLGALQSLFQSTLGKDHAPK